MRAEGNEQEVALYHGLGQISTLQNPSFCLPPLHLGGDIQPPEPVSSSSTACYTFDFVPTHGALHEIMTKIRDEKTNLAEDLDLADQLRASLIDVVMDQEL